MRGPIDYIIAGFEGNNFNGSILRELKKAVDDKTIALLDLAVISKNAQGEVQSVEMAATDDELIQTLAERKAGDGGIIGAEDVAEVGEILDNDTTAGLLIVEHLWAKGLKRAIIDAKGTLLAEGRIHPEAAGELSGAAA
jgi:hypothetical protein